MPYRRAMPDDATSTPSPDPQRTAASAPLCARQVGARYLDARARGLAHDAALHEAAGLLSALLPVLPVRTAERVAAVIVGSAVSATGLR